jgi:purine-binding chemotaxis protein CheW
MNEEIRPDWKDATTREVLRARAKRLAQEVETTPVDRGLEVLEFALAYESYAFETAYVREVCPLNDLTPVPCTPPHFCGIINLRGQILAVLDIKRLFGLPENRLVDHHHVIVLHQGQEDVGILADAVYGVRAVPLRDIQRALPTLTGIHAEYLRGVTSQRLVILDAARLMADQKLIVYEEVTL